MRQSSRVVVHRRAHHPGAKVMAVASVAAAVWPTVSPADDSRPEGVGAPAADAGARPAMSPASPAAGPPPAAVGETCLLVDVLAVRGGRGAVLCALFDQARGFAGSDAAESLAAVRVAARPPTSRCSFCGLSPGVYAVVAVHDENDNGRCDTNLFGVPVEGYAISGGRRRRLAPPRFAESCFLFTAQRSERIALRLRY